MDFAQKVWGYTKLGLVAAAVIVILHWALDAVGVSIAPIS